MHRNARPVTSVVGQIISVMELVKIVNAAPIFMDHATLLSFPEHQV
jgi:hypothetical protein